LVYDSTFARAYAGLAMVYWNKHYWETYFAESFLDSVLYLSDIALSYDKQLSDAYTIRGNYFNARGKTEQALKEFDKAVKFNPNDWFAYQARGRIYLNIDYILAIENFQKAASLNHEEPLPDILIWIGFAYSLAGFSDESRYYWKEALNLDNDSSKYYYNLCYDEFEHSNFKKALEYAYKVYSMDSITNQLNPFFNLAYTNLFLGNDKESLLYINKHLERIKASGKLEISGMWIIGYIYWKNGYKEKANYFFDETIKNNNRIISLGREYAAKSTVYYDLGAVYAFRGERDKAYENLRVCFQSQPISFEIVNLLKNDPLFDNIREEPEFQQIVRDYESKYQAEHERMRKWMEEQGS